MQKYYLRKYLHSCVSKIIKVNNQKYLSIYLLFGNLSAIGYLLIYVPNPDIQGVGNYVHSKKWQK